MEKSIDINVASSNEILFNEANSEKPIPTTSDSTKMDDETKSTPSTYTTKLQSLLEEHSNVPEDWNEAFVVNYRITENSEIKFDFVVSTKKLLSNAVGKELISADTTYKVQWQGYTVSPIGSVDKDQKFLLIALGVSTDKKEDFTFIFQTIKNRVMDIFNIELNPTIILCDACKEISNAFLSVFGHYCLVLVCWFNVKKSIERNIRNYFPNEIQQVLDDIDCLQLSTSPELFEIASQLFLQKYAYVEEFVSYFKYEWMEQFRNWYVGAAKKNPSTNNALESFNRYLKQEMTLTERLPLDFFANQLFEWVKHRSVEYDRGA